MSPSIRALWSVPAYVAALISAACSDSPGEAPREAVSVDHSIRLADLLEVAEIDSPLRHLPGATDLDALGEVPQRPVLQEDFEDFDMEAAGWQASERGVIAAAGDQGSAFVLKSHQRRDRRGWVLPATPNTHYVFERMARSETPLDADFAVLEAYSADTLHAELDPMERWESQKMLRLHWPAAPRPDGTWQRGSVSFTTTPQTHAIGVILRTTALRRSELHRWGRRAEREGWFDDIRLAQMQPSPSQMISLLKARALAEGADPLLGMEKHGQFPPPQGHGSAHRPEDDNYSYRYALYAPPTTRIACSVELVHDTELRFSTCLSRETPPGDSARFRVLVRTGGDEEVVWSSTLVAAKKSWLWHDAVVDLAAFTGQQVEVVLETTSASGNPHPMWGNPTLDVSRATQQSRNVILIAVDTLRADRLSCYGYPKSTSPRLDALAADGVRFAHVASNATWTCPSFASIFTGLTPSRHGVWNHGHMTPLSARFETLAERFRAQGWATQSIAYKAPLYGGGYEQGFDVAFNVPRVEVRAQDNLAEALEWLDANAHRRNFLFLHFDDPHQPFTQPKPFDTEFGEDPSAHGVQLPRSFHEEPPQDPELRQLVRGLYDGEVAYVDDRIGAFLDQLKKRGLYDDAAILFVSDHGEELWEHGEFGHSNGKLFDESMRVPLLVKPGAGEFARGAVVETQVRAFDVMPTLLELAGIPVPEDLDAASLVPLLAADAEDVEDRVAVTETTTSGAGLRNRRWKYILEYWQLEQTRESLYDHRADPLETENVAAGNPEVVAEMRIQMLDFHMLHRPGTYLVAIAVDDDAPYQHVVRGAKSAITFFGTRARVEEGDTLTFDGQSAGRLSMVADLNVTGPLSLDGGEPGDGSPARYAAGDLARLLRSGAAGVHLFEGPPRLEKDTTQTQTLDLEQVEALRALGYFNTGETTPEGDK